jgi:streptogramin lyase/signal transduction histidine kinase
LLKYDRENGRFICYRNDPDDPDSVPQNNLDALFEDREGGIWVGLGRMGVVRFATRPLPFKRVPHAPGTRVEPFVGAIAEDRQGVLWVGTPDSLNRIERTTGRFASYRNGGPTTPTDVVSLREDPSGDLWVGTYGHGLLRFEPRTGKFRAYKPDPADPHSLSNDTVLCLLFDHSGTLWAGTYTALSRFDAAAQQFTTYNLGPPDKSPAYLALVEDREGSLWLGTRFSGLQRFNPATGEVQTYEQDTNRAGTLSDNRVNSLHFDPTGTLWVGTQNGLDKLDPKTGRFTVYTRRDGLPGNSVGAILEDDRGNLWVSTNNGVARFDPRRRSFSTFSTADGLPGPNFTGWGASFRSSSGEMFFGGFSGATAFFPDQVVDNSSAAPPIVLTDFRLSGNPVNIGGRSPLPKSISYVKDLVLSHQQNIFSFTFALLSYGHSETNRYRYKLEGLEADWNEGGSDHRQVTYTTLPAGTYTFRVQGATSGGGWTDPGVAVRIEVLPAWWETWWFESVCASLALALLWLAYYLRVRRIAWQFNLRLEERVGERTRIARELHDTLLQNFHGLLLRFQSAYNYLPSRPEEARKALGAALDRGAQAITAARDTVQELRSPSSVTNELSSAIAVLSEELRAAQSEGPSPDVEIQIEGEGRELHPMLREEIYRITAEALRNAFRHAQAARIDVAIQYGDHEFRIAVRDNGKGIDPEVLKQGSRSGHWGLPGMRERAEAIGGELGVWSRNGEGTEVRLRLPAVIAYALPPARRLKWFNRTSKEANESNSNPRGG